MEKNKYIIVSYYTENTPYKQVAIDYLKKSLKKFPELDLSLRVMPNYEDWFKNTALKPRVIKHVLDIMPDTNVVFLDADATVEQYPKLFDEIPEEYDMAVHYLDWKSWYGHQSNIKEMLSGTMYLRNNDKVKLLCEEWYDESIKGHQWEQKVLQKLLDKYSVTVYNLPLEYCYIKTRPGGLEPLVKLEPVILHHQVSRELKNKLK